ncbi:sphingomyelin phosphodiesterase, partial [Calocera cornea HHB12733]
IGTDALKDAAKAACEASGLEDKDVCDGLVDQQMPTIATVLRNITGTGYAAQLFCANIVGVCAYPALENTTVTFPPFAPSFPPPPSTEEAYLTVVHLSDWHYDPLYKAGTEAQCTKPLCCRGFNASSPDKASRPASQWGAYQCDTPLALGVSALQSIEPILGSSPTFSIFTGDLPPHDVWATSEEGVVSVSDLNGLFKQYLKTAVYPAIGNHETSPVNLNPIPFPPTNQYLYNNLTLDDWVDWLDEDALEFARANRGSYATSPLPGMKILNVNSNFCYVDNFWLYGDWVEVDPTGQLAWLAEELAIAEAEGEKVWIIMHVATGLSDCLRNWSNLHDQIVKRFHSTIVGVFSGHTHRDEYELFWSDDGNKTPANAIVMNWIGPSVTPFTQLNPGWREYKVHPTTFEIMESYTYIADLSLASEWDAEGIDPEWFLEYSARDYLPSWPKDSPLNATFWALVTASFEEDDELWQEFYRYRSKSGPEAEGGCSGDCKSDIINGLRSGNSVTAIHSSSFGPDEPHKAVDASDTKPWTKGLCRLHTHY